MSDTTLTEQATTSTPSAAAAMQAECQECVGSGGWFRYEPALEPSPGLLYLSCVQCRGTGKTAAARG
jgi:DnaJ-class molecular chaperone